MNVSVLGCGRWGSFLAWYLHSLGHDVTLYGRKTSENLARLKATRENRYVRLSDDIRLTDDLGDALQSRVLFISINSQNLRSLAREISSNGWDGEAVVLCMKGLEQTTGRRLSQVASEELGGPEKIAIWVGPGHIQDFTAGIPNCMLVDAYDPCLRQSLSELLGSRLIRIYTGADMIGNEVGAAAKNAYGIAAGMLDALGYESLKGALLARSAVEVSRLTEKLGGSPRSVYGLCFLGECETTFFSPHSHNRLYGENFIRGLETDRLCEGIYTVGGLCRLSDETGAELPICRSLDRILRREADAETAFTDLFLRPMKQEF